MRRICSITIIYAIHEHVDNSVAHNLEIAQRSRTEHFLIAVHEIYSQFTCSYTCVWWWLCSRLTVHNNFAVVVALQVDSPRNIMKWLWIHFNNKYLFSARWSLYLFVYYRNLIELEIMLDVSNVYLLVDDLKLCEMLDELGNRWIIFVLLNLWDEMMKCEWINCSIAWCDEIDRLFLRRWVRGN